MNNNHLGWYPFDDGGTIGKQGTEHGAVIRDEEHVDGARITLEQNTVHAPYAITCGIYDWMFHTRFFADEATALAALEEMKIAISHILSLMPGENDPNTEARFAQVSTAIGEFVRRFP